MGGGEAVMQVLSVLLPMEQSKGAPNFPTREAKGTYVFCDGSTMDRMCGRTIK